MSKGWQLIQRFSEDIDLFLDNRNPDTGEPVGKKATNTLLKQVAERVGEHPDLTLDEGRTERIDGVARTYYFDYTSQVSGIGGIPATVKLEMGIQSGDHPTETRPLASLLGEFLDANGLPRETEDREPFPMRLLHFRRTFIEKMFALHHKVERGWLEEGTPLGSYARHYYDLSHLIQQDEVKAMLASAEYGELADDYCQVTSKYFSKQLLPAQGDLSHSRAFFPGSELASTLEAEYDRQCSVLCYGEYMPFRDVLRMFDAVQPQLRRLAL